MENSATAIISGDEMLISPGHTFEREPDFPYYTLGCLVEGSFIIRDANGERVSEAVSLSLTPPNTPYAIACPAAHREIWIIFAPRPEWSPWVAWSGSGRLMLPDDAHRERLLRGLRDVLAYTRSILPTGPRLAELALEQVLVLSATLAARPGGQDDRIEQVLAAIRQAVSRPWREAELAALAHLSVSRFAHLFRARVGMTPFQYLEGLRMERAKGLLLTTALPVQAIASEVGFPDALHFSTRFRRLVGCCPRDFRRGQLPQPAGGGER
jgi:AraC family transcriptional regulator of arabinose operon